MSTLPNLEQMAKLVEDMQKNMEKIQKTMEEKRVTATAGTGDIVVKATGNGMQQIQIEISEGAYDAGRQALQELVESAVNRCLEKSRDITKDAMLNLYEQTTGGHPSDAK